MKARCCANGRPQEEYITKEESSSPTVLLYALMGLCLMDAIDRRKVLTGNIPGAFVQGNWPQDEHHGYIMFKGIIVDMICEIDPSYHDKVIWSNAVYTILLGEIIFYNQLTKHLTNPGFIQNKYDMRTFNKMVKSE